MKFILFLISILLLPNLQAETLRVNDPFHSPESEFMSAIWTEVTKRNNLNIIMQKTPNKRSLMNANAGIDDADAARIFTISEFYPNLVQVPESIYNFEIVAITKKNDVTINELNDLKPFHIGVIRGMKIAEIKSAEINPASIIKTTDYTSLLNLLNLGRIDIALVDKMGILHEILINKDSDVYYMHEPSLIQVKLYMQLNKRFKKYVQPFAETLKEMKQDGSYEKYFNQHINLVYAEKVKIL